MHEEGTPLTLLPQNASAFESFDLLHFLTRAAVPLEDKPLFDWVFLNMSEYQIIGKLQVKLHFLQPKDKHVQSVSTACVAVCSWDTYSS